MHDRAGQVTALLNAAGITCSVVTGRAVAVIAADIGKARDVINARTDYQHDTVGITMRDGTHVALLPVTELPPSPPPRITAPALPIGNGRT